jgi:hypothetical protein
VVPEDVAPYGQDVADRLSALLGTAFVGAYFVGSVALGGYVPGESDVDIIAVSAQQLDPRVKRSIADDLLALTGRCPARGMEFTLYRQEVVATVPEDAGFEVNVNGGPRMPRSVHLEADAEPGFWYVLDRAIAHRCGVRISGPPAGELFADAPRPVLLDAMVASMQWHRRHERATLYSVLNASRAWRYAAEGALGSKLEGAAWARQRWHRPDLIDAAVALRHGRGGQLDEAAVDQFLGHVEGALVNSS